MTTSEFSERFIASIERSARIVVPTEELGRVLAAFRVIGGGSGCIVVLAEEMVVRLSEHGGIWIAEHLVVRGENGQ
jgi:hypothetical protein